MRLPLGAPPSHAREDRPFDGVAAKLDASILVSDDKADAAESLVLLRAPGARDVMAHDGKQALRMFRDKSTDITILDLGTPRVDFLETTRQLPQASPMPFCSR